MSRHRFGMLYGFIWVAIVIGLGACQPTEVVVEKPVTREVTQSVTRLVTIEVTVEETVVVTEQETVQLVVTSTPTPIPQGGMVVRAAFGDAQTANPLLAADDVSRAFCDLMFEGLLTLDPFTGELAPNLAESWTASQDGLTYTFTLREGLTWSDGEPITASDFWFSYAALKSGALDTPNAAVAARIDRIEVIDDRALSVTFVEADCGNLEALSLGWLPMHVFTDGVESFDWTRLAMHEFTSMPTVFSGPFMLQEWVRGDHWTQVRNPRYWRGAPYLDGVITRVVSGQAEMVEMLQRGELDIGQEIKPQYLYDLEQQPDLRIWKFLSDEYDFIGLQLGDPAAPEPGLNAAGAINKDQAAHPILGDRRVRQAIGYALDRDELINKARFGQGIPLQANVLPMVSWAVNTDLEAPARDIERAAALLDEAGWAMNTARGIRQKEGMPLRLQLTINSGNAVREVMAGVIRDQLAEVGLEIEVIAIPWAEFRDLLYGQTFDLALTSWGHLGVNPDDAAFWLASSDEPGIGSNFVSYYNPEVEDLLIQARAVPGCDQDIRAGLYRQVQAQLYQDQPYVWIGVPRNLVAVSSRVGGLNPGPWDVWGDVHLWYIVE